MTSEDIAQASTKAMWSNDSATQWLGISIVNVTEGQAVAQLTVETHHCNGHGMCHGGITFTLADTAFAYACNSRNAKTVAHHNMISYTAPAQLGDTLTATAREVSLAGRNGIYDVTIVNQDSRLVAEFRGFSRAIGGTVFDQDRRET